MVVGGGVVPLGEIVGGGEVLLGAKVGVGVGVTVGGEVAPELLNAMVPCHSIFLVSPLEKLLVWEPLKATFCVAWKGSENFGGLLTKPVPFGLPMRSPRTLLASWRRPMPALFSEYFIFVLAGSSL
jgi:hypothetical protein